MEQYIIDRINELARIAKERELTQEETGERAQLRAEYISRWRNSVSSALDNTYVVSEDGTKRKIQKKEQ